MQELTNKLQQIPIIYVTRDIERALGLVLNKTKGVKNPPNYYIISNYTDSCNLEDKKNTLLIKEKKQLNTWELLKHKKTKEFINKFKNVNLVVFKSTKQIERICTKNNWKLLNPPAELSDKIEEKISQLDWLGDLKKYLPDYSVKKCKDIEFTGDKFILQFNRSHTGSGTILIESNEQLNKIKNKFPEREARLATYIEGPLFTNNNIVSKNKTLIGNISYQITGLKPFTDLPFATIGNDWGWPRKYLSDEQIKQYHKIVNDIGNKLREDGWKGLFGVDIVIKKSTGKLYLVEINARQPASTTFESQLQQTTSAHRIRGNNEQRIEITTFEAHLASLLDLDLDNYELISINEGAQIVQRVTEEIPSLPEPKFWKKSDINIIKYNNTESGSDLLRQQFHYSIIESHNKLNQNGIKAMNFITVTAAGKGWDMPRGGIIAIKDKKILLIERKKYGEHFFVLPGGTAEEDEDIKTTAKREGNEETGLEFTIPEQEPLYFEQDGRDEYYFFVKNIKGIAKLSGEELERNTPNNQHSLVWVDLKKLSNIKLIPERLTKKILSIMS